ncbi:MAG TPA: pirin family protein [Nitrospiria bacterium]
MRNPRKIKKTFKSKPTIEGAGVRLKRVFGNSEVPQFDPFLLMDDFHSRNPDDYIKGFPWHPHRGIETITYVLHGEVEHGDSMGNKGIIHSGDIQWMTAGSGIIHQEMPKVHGDGLMWGFQLWANLPSSQKMMAPRYREVRSHQIPEVKLENGGMVKVVCGKVEGVHGPVKDIVIDPDYLDVSLPSDSGFKHPVKEGYTVFAYLLQGKGCFDSEGGALIEPETLVAFGDGDCLSILAGEGGMRFLLVSGKPIGEPVAWYGPIVMNTQEELKTAFEEYQLGTFLKQAKT